MADERVAYFEIRTADCDEYGTHCNIDICGNEQFYLGRDAICRYSWVNDLLVSRLHLRIHCILYDQNPDSKIAPFVYATDLSANGTHLKKSNADCAGSQGRGFRMGRNSTFLLDDGDELQISDSVTLIYQSLFNVHETVLTQTQVREKNTFASRYLVTGRLLGEGAFGKVLVGIDQKTQGQVACKLVKIDRVHNPDKSLRNSANEHRLSFANRYREFEILKDLSHPNIVAIEKVFWSQSTIYIFQELVTGGDLFSFLAYKGGVLDCILAAVIIRQMLKGLEYLHHQNIVHRDIKPENVLMTSLDDGARVVLTDFGNARYLPEASRGNQVQRMFSLVGTPIYAAPEVYKAKESNGYSKSIDMWSIGSITTTLLAGEPLFADRDHSENGEYTRARMSECDLSILDEEYHPVWGVIGTKPKNFIRRLLVLDEKRRMSATEALAHAWFSDPFYAADFDDLYERSIKDWRPRVKDTQLVEQIPTLAHTTGSMDALDDGSAEAVVSGFFRKTPEHDIMQSLSAAQRQRANTPLPAITDDYEPGQFASPVAPTQRSSTSGETGRYHSNHYSYPEQIEDATPVYDEYHTYDSDAFEDELPTIPQDAQGKYQSTSSDEYGDDASMDEVMDEAYEVLAVNEYREDMAKPAQDDEVHDTEMVQETPPRGMSRQVFT